MLDTEKPATQTPKPVTQTPVWSDPQEWAEMQESIVSLIEFGCKDQARGYLELKGFAERQLARLGVHGKTQTDLRDEIMPKHPESPAAPGTKRRGPSDRLDDLLAAVVADPEAWLSTPNKQLGGRRPGDLIGTPEEIKVVSLLQAVDQGLF